MADNQAATAPVPSTMGFARMPGFHYSFANQTRIRISPGEITVIFSYGDETPAGQVLSEITSVTMTPTHTRRFLVTLSEMLKAYEQTIAPIPQETLTPLDITEISKRVEEILKAPNPK